MAQTKLEQQIAAAVAAALANVPAPAPAVEQGDALELAYGSAYQEAGGTITALDIDFARKVPMQGKEGRKKCMVPVKGYNHMLCLPKATFDKIIARHRLQEPLTSITMEVGLEDDSRLIYFPKVQGEPDYSSYDK